MTEDLRALVAEIAVMVKDKLVQTNLAYWQMAGTGDQAAAERAAQLEQDLRLYTSDRTVFARLKAALAEPTGDRLLDRQVKLLHDQFADNQLEPALIGDMVKRSMELQQIFNTFRGTIAGKKVSDNEIKEILKQSHDRTLRQEAWIASKQVGADIAPRLVELVRLRNQAARSLGYRTYYEMQLLLQEIEPAELFRLLGELKAQTDGPFYAMKQQLDAEQAARFGISPGDLRPYDYGDPFFQEAPRSEGVDLDPYFAGKSIEELSVQTFDGVGLDVRDIIARSDLYEREGKNQHAFCTDIDRDGDVRVLCNLRPTTWWMSTMLHELGHGVYDKYVDRELPWLLRTIAHINSTEAIAMYFGRLTGSAEWLVRYAGLSQADADRTAAALKREMSRSMLIFVRWVLVMTHFESRLYENPDQDLNRLWWSIVGEMQLLTPPAELTGHEWATKIHLSMAPVYYHNYLIGELTASHLQAHIARETGTDRIVENAAVGDWLKDRFFKSGALYPWNQLVRNATGEELTPRYFVEQFVSGQ